VDNTAAPASSPAKGVAVLALGDAGEILAARDACEAIFGWDPTELVGRNVHVLLKDGLDNEIGRFLHRHRAGMNPAGTIEMNVVALRKDGREFPAHVTTLTWNWGTTASKDGSGDTSRLCWTAGFRDCSPETKPGQGPATAASKSAVAEPAKQAPNPLVPATPVTPVIPMTASGASTNGTTKAEPAPSAPKAQAPANPNPNANAKPNALTTEQVATFETTRRIIELEDQLNKLTAELAGTKTENEKLGCNASELRAQLDAAKEAAGHTEAALREETTRREKMEERLQNLSNQLRVEQAERSQRFGEELVGLRKERDELNKRLIAEQEGANESVRRAQELESSLSRNANEFAHVKAELERQAAEREKSESCWREQLDTAWVAKKELDGALAGAVEQNKKFEEELAKLRREQDELNQKLAEEQKVAEASKERAKEVESRLNRNAADSDRARTELEKENAERKRADAEKARLETSLAEANERVKRLEENLTALRQERDELQNRVKSAEHSEHSEDSSQRTEELQRLVEQHTAELERLTLDLEKQTLERQEAESRALELETTAHDRAKKLEADWTAAVERNMQFEEQLVKARQEYDELNEKFAAEKQTAVEADGARAELETERAERKRADAEWREQLNAAKTLKTRLEKSLTEASEQVTRLEEEMAALRSERDELQERMKTEQQSAEESSRRADDLQRKVDQNAGELAQVTAELKQLSTERQEAEARAGEQQESAQALTRKLEADWTTAVERNVRFEEELVTLRKERDGLTLQIKTEKRATADAAHQATELQRRLERNAAELQRLTAEVGKKRSERARVETEGRDQLEAAKALARKLDSAWTTATERSRRFEAEVAALRQERAELQGKLASLQRESAHFKALAAQLQHQAGASAEPARGNEKVGPSRNRVEGPDVTNGTANHGSTFHPRRDVSLTNGHHKPQTEDAKAAGVIPPRNGHEGKNGSADHAQAAPRHAGDLQQYNFSEQSAAPAQADTSLTKKRLQP
jgi:PAS domain S-box-containing protein